MFVFITSTAFSFIVCALSARSLISIFVSIVELSITGFLFAAIPLWLSLMKPLIQFFIWEILSIIISNQSPINTLFVKICV